MFSSLLPFTHITRQRSRCWGEAGWSNGLQGNTIVPCSLPPPPAKQAANENGSGGGVLLFLPAQQRDKAPGYAGVFSFTHLSTVLYVQPIVRAFGNHHLYLDIKTSYSILSLSANLPFALGHILLLAGLHNPIL